MRVADTDDTLRPGPLAAPARTGDDGGPPGLPASEDREARHQRRAALAREVAALACAVLAGVIAYWSLFTLAGWPAAGLLTAVVLMVLARYLGYGDTGDH